jgi:putative ABC transport system permease protein
MSLSPSSERQLRRCARIVRLAARLVPAYRRAEWEMEWTGELWHRMEQLDGWSATPGVRRRLQWMACGALLHAAWLRAFEWRMRMQDLRYGLRLIARQPGFSLVLVLTLAIGVGANAGMFTILNAVLLRPLPYADPNQLVWMYGSFALNDSASISPPDFLDYRDRNRVFSSMGAMEIGTGSVNLAGSGVPERIGVTRVSADLFSTLGVEPLLGRGFRRDEERVGAARVAVLGYELWRDRFGADKAILGRTLLIDAEPTTIVGVMPSGFGLPFDSLIGSDSDAALWVPIPFGSPGTTIRRFHYLRAVGRLQNGVSIRQAQASMDVIARQLEAAYRENESWKLRLVPLYEHIVGSVRTALLLLQAVVGLVLLVACGNVASLMLARAEAREGEIAVRGALGASRGRLLRQLLTESLLVATLGAAIGMALAYGMVRVVLLGALTGLPRANEISLDVPVLLFAAAVTIATTLICGLVPALRLSADHVIDAIRTRRASTTPARARFQRALVVGQIVASVVLLVAAGLLIRSVWRMQSVPLGFDANRVMTAHIVLPEAVYTTDEGTRAFVSRLLERLRTEPGIARASAIKILPLSGGDDRAVHVAGAPPTSERDTRYAQFRWIAGDFFGVFGIPVTAGATFDDRNAAEARQSIVINRVMADQFFPSANPIGRDLVVDIGRPVTLRVIGVVGNVREWGPATPVAPIMYVSHHLVVTPGVNVAVRAAGSPSALTGALERAVHAIDRDLAVAQVRPMSDVVALRMAQPRVRAIALAAFAAVALGLTVVGLYGTLAYSVARRRHEIGVRLALGAQPRSIVRDMVRQGAAMVGIGLGVGSAAAFGATRLMGSFLFEVTPTDPPVFATVLVSILICGLVASLVPARRAARVDPIATLRNE